MKDFVQFIVKFWSEYKELIYILVALLCFILGLIIKKKKTLNELDKILLEVSDRLPSWINEAELLKGSDVKKQFVLSCAQKFVKDQFSINLPDSLLALIGQKIEKILETPQKH